jgi:hypothetical protein
MKQLRISIFKIITIIFLFNIISVNAKELSIETGMYDFADPVARDFYNIAPSFLIAYDVFYRNGFALNLSSGLIFNSIDYDGNRHNLFIVPIFFNALYYIPMRNSRVKPLFGFGIGIYGKIDHNVNFEQNHYALLYGYDILSGMNIHFSSLLSLRIMFRYNFIIPPRIEDVNIKGINISIGLSFNLGRSRN